MQRLFAKIGYIAIVVIMAMSLIAIRVMMAGLARRLEGEV